jgi:hypothetical protein
VGAIGEEVVARHYDGTRVTSGVTGYDVLLPDGTQIQVKTRRRFKGSAAPRIGGMRSEAYDVLIIVLLDEEYRVTEGLRMTRATFDSVCSFSPHIHSKMLGVTQELRAHPGVETLTLSDAFLDAPVD